MLIGALNIVFWLYDSQLSPIYASQSSHVFHFFPAACKKRHTGGEDQCWILHPEKNPYNKDKKDEDKDKGEKKP